MSRLSAALNRLYAMVERYPELKGDRVVRDELLEARRWDERVVLARSDFVSAVQAHNAELQRVPDRWVAAVLHPDAKPLRAFSQAQLQPAIGNSGR